MSDYSMKGEIYGLAVAGGVAVAQLINMPILGYTISGMGCIAAIMEFIEMTDPYNKLFTNLRLTIGEETPKLLKRRNTDYGQCLEFSLPVGLCSGDFIKRQLAIEEHLNRKIDISYNNHRIYIKVYENNLDPEQEYRFIETKNICEFPIGITFGDRMVNVDLEKVVHLLIAGQTGSGKSTLLRGIITNLIKDKSNSKKEKLYLHLIDLKNGAEFNIFRKCRIVKSFSRAIEEAEEVLSKLDNEVEKRYNLFFENNVVSILEYNKIKGIKKLPYEICIIDEFADLQDEKGSISTIENLGRKARAAGIHLILATQRPSANIINGNIKANIPCVIGLKTMNSLNSRIIIDQDGLEGLRGKGHGYLQFSDLTEFQSMHLSVEQARELIKDTYIEKPLKQVNKIAIEEKKIGVVEDLSFLKGLVR